MAAAASLCPCTGRGFLTVKQVWQGRCPRGWGEVVSGELQAGDQEKLLSPEAVGQWNRLLREELRENLENSLSKCTWEDFWGVLYRARSWTQ